MDNAAAITPLLSIQGIAKSYGHVRALQGVDMNIYRGEVTGLLGDNGAGKSTLIKILSGIIRPDTGKFMREGQEISVQSRRDSEEIAGIQTIYQDIALVKSMSILRNIFAGREERYPFGFLKMKKMRETAMSILNEHVKIAGITSPDLLVEELSGGQAQAVAIARAVHFQRDILLLDEPTSALSVRETNKVLAIMRDIAEGGRSCVFVTHNLYHAYQVCDRFVVVSHGTVVKSVRKEETSLDELTALIMTH
ncbi:ATP-binding cassette domain-containing protein [Pararhizobium sp. LjRoot238]|uniref:ATP-binding cassette domain-containing protein n=1 Tax=Pararhizobium sp. LjRoot238 TaxID=3342293 RepID=UPI003ECF10D5